MVRMSETCETCRWWGESNGVTGMCLQTEEHEVFGAFGPIDSWPWSGKFNWCGEWEALNKAHDYEDAALA